MSAFAFFLYGLIIGSFLNVVILRLQKEESLGGRSHCPACQHQIRWYDNIPLVSFLFLRGKCRDCYAKISLQYPSVEVLTGAVFAVTGYAFFDPSDQRSWLDTLFYLVLFSTLIVIGVYDFLTMYIPMLPVWLAVVWVTAYLILSQGLSQRIFFSSDIFFVLFPFGLAALGAFLFFYALVFVSDETWMGMGDAYLAALIGLATGWPGVLWTLTLSFAIGAIVGLILVASGEKGMKSQIPFGPFLVIGVTVFLLVARLFPMLDRGLFL